MMEKPKPHPQLVMLHERFGSRASAITLRGFVGPSAEGLVRLFPTPNSSDCIEIPQAAILHYEQADVSGSTELFVDPSVIVTAISTRKVPLLALALPQQDGGGGAPVPEKTCLETRIENCKNDPTQDPKFCDSEAAKDVFRILCAMFGKPLKFPGPVIV